MLLLTLPAFRDVLAEQVTGKKKILKSGVRTIVSDFEDTMKIRTFQELLFVIHTQTEKHVLSSEPETLAAQLAASDLLQILAETHKGEAPFYFRIGVSGGMALEERSSFSRQTAAAIEKAFARKLINLLPTMKLKFVCCRTVRVDLYRCLSCILCRITGLTTADIMWQPA
mgnify:FL=1